MNLMNLRHRESKTGMERNRIMQYLVLKGLKNFH
jgi:hypothetical protein